MDSVWVAKEFSTLELGDERLSASAAYVAARVLEHPATSLPHAWLGWAETKAAYRLLDNEKMVPNAILEAHRNARLERINDIGDERMSCGTPPH